MRNQKNYTFASSANNHINRLWTDGMEMCLVKCYGMWRTARNWNKFDRSIYISFNHLIWKQNQYVLSVNSETSTQERECEKIKLLKMRTRSNVFLYPQSWSEHITWLFWVRVLDFPFFVDPIRILSTENFSKWTHLSPNHESSGAVMDIMHKEAILYSTIYLTFPLCSAIAFPSKVQERRQSSFS